MATITTKSLLTLGIAGSIAGTSATVVALLPSTIAQILEEEGYQLISKIDKTKQEAIFEARRSEYNQANNNQIFIPKENGTNVSKEDFKALCSKYENSWDSSFKDKVAKWCTLNIEDYLTKVESGTYNNKGSSDTSWGTKYNSLDNKAEVKALIELSSEEENNPGPKLHAWCTKAKAESYSKKNKKNFENAKLLCLSS